MRLVDNTEPFHVDLITIRRGGKKFGAGQCVVTIGTVPLNAIAVMTDDQRHITTEEFAAVWLIDHGLLAEDAWTLISAAQGDQNALKLLGEEVFA
jgi:hypothetical protein